MAAAFAAASVLFVPALAHADTSGSVRLGTSTLRVGDHGTAVKQLQKLLAKAGFATPADGQYGDGTAKVVRRFQRAANLKATGVADAGTIRALRRATNGSAAVNTSGGFDLRGTGTTARHLGDRIPLHQGMSGHDVKILQDFLSRAGFKTGIDGDYGAGTVKSVKQFETDQQVEVDGVMDAADIDLLRSLVTGDTTDPATPVNQPAALAPGDQATIGPDGLALAPANAPDQVKQIIAAGNQIAKKPYVYGGGHGSWTSSGYDCSGSVSYALHGAGLLDSPLTSGDFESWGTKGPGQWVTIYANAGHVYMMVAGLRFDTSGRQQDGTRWHTDKRSGSGYVVVHPTGL